MATFIVAQLMQNHQIDLRAGESIKLGQYKVTLLEIDGDGGVVLEIEGPDGDIQVEPISFSSAESDRLLAVIA